MFHSGMSQSSQHNIILTINDKRIRKISRQDKYLSDDLHQSIPKKNKDFFHRNITKDISPILTLIQTHFIIYSIFSFVSS